MHLVSLIGGSLMPPLQIGNDPVRDVLNFFNEDKDNTFYTLRNVPLVGKVSYEWFTDTSENAFYPQLRTSITTKAKEGKSYGSLRSEINRYNAWARKEKKPLITFATLRQAKKRSSVP